MQIYNNEPNKVKIQETLMRQEAEKAADLTDKMQSTFWVLIGTANQCAYVAIDDAVEAMQDAGMMRHQAKQKAQQAVSEYKKYEHLVYQHYKANNDDRYYLWCDLVSRAAEKLDKDIKKLYYAVKNVIDRYNVQNSEVYAKIQTALALTSLATLLYDQLVSNYQSQTIVNISQSVSAGRLTSVERNWLSVADITSKGILPRIDLSSDKACQLGIKVILARYASADFLNEAAREAMRLNPSCKKYLHDGEWEKINEEK